jgi:hypothetical protein
MDHVATNATKNNNSNDKHNNNNNISLGPCYTTPSKSNTSSNKHINTNNLNNTKICLKHNRCYCHLELKKLKHSEA